MIQIRNTVRILSIAQLHTTLLATMPGLRYIRHPHPPGNRCTLK